MGGAFLLAWLTGEAIICYRSVKVQGGPPWPGQLLAGTGAFAALAILAEAGPEARKIALTVAWGLNAAAFLNLFAPADNKGPLNAGMASLTGTNPQNKGWWGNVTASQINTNYMFPGTDADGTPHCLSQGTLA